MTTEFSFIDLFAGCGGLSVGLRQAGFSPRLAVEVSDMAAETYYHNLINRVRSSKQWQEFVAPETPIDLQAKKGLVVKPLSELLKCGDLVRQLAEEDIDLVAGGPPCQGFSQAGRRNHDDKRNLLAWEFLEFVSLVNPKAVIIENVAGMRLGFKKQGLEPTFDRLRIALEGAGRGYVVQPMLLNAMHFGVPQYRPRVFLVAIRSDLAATVNLKSSSTTWRSGAYDVAESLLFPERPSLAPEVMTTGNGVVTVKDAISDLTRNGYSVRQNLELSDYAIEMRTDTGWMPDQLRSAWRSKTLRNQEIRRHSDRVKLRFKLYQALAAASVPLGVVSLPLKPDAGPAAVWSEVASTVAEVKYPLVSPDGTTLAESEWDLIPLIIQLATKKHSQRALFWDQPSYTVLSLPDDFVHPRQPRTLTVRELARFQSFPDAFVFRSKVTTGGPKRKFEVPQYTQVGNAVPPKLAKAIGLKVKEVLSAVAHVAGRSGDGPIQAAPLAIEN